MTDEKNPLQAVIDVLEPLDSDHRQRVVSAAMTYLGESLAPSQKNKGGTAEPQNKFDAGDYPPRVQAWITQNKLTQEQLENVFHKTGAAYSIIAVVPGSGSTGVLNNYLLVGITRFLETGDPSFDDQSGRNACKSAGCYQGGNHAKYMSQKGNALSGDVKAGWSITQPGLIQAAKLIVEMQPKNG